MRINNNVVHRFAYITRPSMVAIEAPKPINSQSLTSTRPLPAVNANARCGVGWRAYNPLPAHIVVTKIDMMPLQVGRQKRDHRQPEVANG